MKLQNYYGMKFNFSFAAHGTHRHPLRALVLAHLECALAVDYHHVLPIEVRKLLQVGGVLPLGGNP